MSLQKMKVAHSLAWDLCV